MNPGGVRSYVEKGIRHTEPVRLIPTREGMRAGVPEAANKPDEFQVATPNHLSKVEYSAEKSESTTPTAFANKDHEFAEILANGLENPNYKLTAASCRRLGNAHWEEVSRKVRWRAIDSTTPSNSA